MGGSTRHLPRYLSSQENVLEVPGTLRTLRKFCGSWSLWRNRSHFLWSLRKGSPLSTEAHTGLVSCCEPAQGIGEELRGLSTQGRSPGPGRQHTHDLLHTVPELCLELAKSSGQQAGSHSPTPSSLGLLGTLPVAAIEQPSPKPDKLRDWWA